MRIEVDERGGALVVRDELPQSYVDLDDPGLLVFEYVQHLALVLDALRPGASPLAVTHVGGGGMTLPRWVQHTRPGSPQIVLEPDVALTELVRRELPLPRGHHIRVRPVTGEDGVGDLKDGSADVVVLDAFDDGRIPVSLTGSRWVAEIDRVLSPTGLLLVNASDEPGLRWVARYAATLRTRFPSVGRMLLREIASGRRYGNVVLVAARGPLDDVALTRAAARADFPSVWHGSAQLQRAGGGALPFSALGEPSPPPPPAGVLRLR